MFTTRRGSEHGSSIAAVAARPSAGYGSLIKPDNADLTGGRPNADLQETQTQKVQNLLKGGKDWRGNESLTIPDVADLTCEIPEADLRLQLTLALEPIVGAQYIVPT